MNEKIVPYLLEGMKAVTRDQYVESHPISHDSFLVASSNSYITYRPPNPLRVLGEFLIQKSNEVESGATSTSTSTKVSD